MKAKQIAFIFLVAVVGAAAALGIDRMMGPNTAVIVQQSDSPAVFTSHAGVAAAALDFTEAAEKSLEAVVHVKTRASVNQQEISIFDFFYGNPYQNRGGEPPITGSGSGVIITNDGYIVTNNHVIEGSGEVEVTLNDNRTFKATLVGTDPTTDIALLKIDAKDLHNIPWGDSDGIKVGEWVLAVGNPFNLTSTVTAGIVSAKGRSINIIDKRMAIESFIQTDAAVNPGNSGGALVNVRGELVGINTAIASQTGSFTGYSFAVPTAIARKVVSDIMEYGHVQRAVLGVQIATMSSEIAEKLNLKMEPGVLVTDIAASGAAAKSGMKRNDIITAINSVKVTKANELQEQIGRHRPGDKVSVTVSRDGSAKSFEITLQNIQGTTKLVTTTAVDALGASFEPLNEREKYQLRIAHGLQVKELKDGKLKEAGVQKGFVIVRMNDSFIDSQDDIEAALSKADGGVMIKGIYPNGVVQYYAFGLD